MVHSEFGQDRLTQPHPQGMFELAEGAIKGAFVLFSTTLLGLVGFVLQDHPFFATELAWFYHASPRAASSFPRASSGSPKALVLLKRFSHPATAKGPFFSSCLSLACLLDGGAAASSSID